MEDRFETVYKQNVQNLGIGGITLFIFKDKITGVKYIYTWGPNGMSTMTPLLDADGMPSVEY